jgi:hypothetical protein
MTFWENKPASKQKNEPITVKQNNSNTPASGGSTAPAWFKNSEKAYAEKYSNAPAVTGGSSGGGGNSGRNVYIGNQAYGYDTARVKSAEEMSALMGGYNYDEGAIRALFDKATKAEYAAKRAANQGAQRQFAANMGDYITTLSDTMRQQLNQAVATGGSRGLAAAQAMQAAQDASLKTVDEATKLTEDAMALDFEEAAAYTQNAKDAEALRATRQQNLMNFASGLYDIDERTTVGAMSAAADAWGSQHYGEIGTKYNADANKATEQLVAEIQSNDNLRSALASLISNGALVPDDNIAKLFGVAPGSLRNPPQNNGYYGGGYSGGYSGNGNIPPQVAEGNVDATNQAWSNYNKYLMAEDKNKATGSINGLSGWDDPKAREQYVADKNLIRDTARKTNMTFAQFSTWLAQTYGGTEADARKFWNGYAKNPKGKHVNYGMPTVDVEHNAAKMELNDYIAWAHDQYGYTAAEATQKWNRYHK